MASNTVDMKWEWPAGRTIGPTLLVKIESIKPASRGLFGIKASPSMADALPDATEVIALVDEQAALLAGQRVHVRLPGIEARKLTVGDWAAMGLIDAGRVCACVAGTSARDAAEARQWLGTSPCR